MNNRKVAGENLLEIMRCRRSVRTYTGEPVNEGKLEMILQAALLGATGRARRPWNYIVVREKTMLEKLSHCREHGSQMLKGADCAIVVIGDEETSDTWIEDCSIAMANMYLMADALGLGCCWIHGRGRIAGDGRVTEEFVRDLLGFPENYKLEAIMSIGVPAGHPEGYNLDELLWDKVHQETF